MKILSSRCYSKQAYLIYLFMLANLIAYCDPQTNFLYLLQTYAPQCVVDFIHLLILYSEQCPRLKIWFCIEMC